MTAVLVTGSEGFIGQNLGARLRERGIAPIGLARSNLTTMPDAVAGAEFVFHLAGVNRSADPAGFEDNPGFTRRLCEALADAGNPAPIVYASSIQALNDSPYGRSKRAAEEVLLDHARATGAPIRILRLPNVFGKWARPDYNSAVATFCHNIARGLDIVVHDPAAPLSLAYVDDVVTCFLALLDKQFKQAAYADVEPCYGTTVGDVADLIGCFARSRETLITAPVGAGLERALYATYVSYLPPEHFAYGVPIHADARGVFVEMLKTRDSGQFSYFTAGPGVTRGNHYHHSKTEKFLVLAGTAHFGFRHMQSGETHEIIVRGGEGRIVETVPGWTHNIANIGEEELVVMLWANEIFDPARPDTVAMAV